MELIDRLNEQLDGGRKYKIVFPEGHELRVLKGVSMAKQHDYLDAYVLGDMEVMEDLIRTNNLDMDGVHLIDINTTDLIDRYADAVTEIAHFPTPIIAKSLLKEPNNLAAAMLRLDDYDASISGVISATSEVVTGNKLILGMAEGYSLTCGLMIADCPYFKGEDGTTVVMADCSDNINPTAEEMAEIAIITGRNAEKITGHKSRVAMISFSTYGSATAPESVKVIDATKLVREKAPDLMVDGELQLDAAVNPVVAATKLKGKTSDVAGRANVLIYPDINAGNVAVKIMINFGDAVTWGVLVQGLKKPVCDMSRGSTAEEVRDMVPIVCAMVED